MLDTIAQCIGAHRLEAIALCLLAEIAANAFILRVARQPLYFALPGLVFLKLVDYGRSVILLMTISFVFLATALVGIIEASQRHLLAFLELAVIAIFLKLLVAWGMKRMRRGA